VEKIKGHGAKNKPLPLAQTKLPANVAPMPREFDDEVSLETGRHTNFEWAE